MTATDATPARTFTRKEGCATAICPPSGLAAYLQATYPSAPSGPAAGSDGLADEIAQRPDRRIGHRIAHRSPVPAPPHDVGGQQPAQVLRHVGRRLADGRGQLRDRDVVAVEQGVEDAQPG